MFKSVLSALVFGLLVSSQCLAEFKVATVDVNRVLNESKEAQARKKKLDDMTLEVRKKVEAKKGALKDLEDRIKSGKVTEDSKEADQYRAQMKDLERMVKDSQEDLKKEFLKSNKELTDKALGFIKTYASQNNIDVVFDKSEAARGTVIYSGNILDITDPITKNMNK